jgi:inhibitor of KinA sporulation pathway (predicted exonuclease)
MSFKKRYDRIVVIDLEATCWDEKNYPDELQGEQPKEIIEIGACMIDLNEEGDNQVKQKTSYLVRPRKSLVSQFCTDLTGITPEMLRQKGIPLRDAVNKLRKEFGTTNKVWMSWGEYDKHMLRRECEAVGAEYPFRFSHINLSPLFLFFEGLSESVALEEAVKRCGMVFDGRQHRAHNDAYMTAWVFLTLINKYKLRG